MSIRIKDNKIEPKPKEEMPQDYEGLIISAIQTIKDVFKEPIILSNKKPYQTFQTDENGEWYRDGKGNLLPLMTERDEIKETAIQNENGIINSIFNLEVVLSPFLDEEYSKALIEDIKRLKEEKKKEPSELDISKIKYRLLFLLIARKRLLSSRGKLFDSFQPEKIEE